MLGKLLTTYCFLGATIGSQIFTDNNFLDRDHKLAALKEKLFAVN